jgi:hypothetical protein
MRIGRTINVYKLARNCFLGSSDEARQHLLEALENDPDIIDEMVDFILVNAEAELYRQNPVFRELLGILGNKGSFLHCGDKHRATPDEVMKMRETLSIPITERNQFDGANPPLRPGGVARVVRCERDEELYPDRVYWVYHRHEDALVGMLFARAIVLQGRVMFALHGGTIISSDDAVVAGILSRSADQDSLKR